MRAWDYGANDPNELQSLYDLGIDFPLADDPAVMMARAAQLEFPAVRALHLVPFVPVPRVSIDESRVRASYRRYKGDASWLLSVSPDLLEWETPKSSPFTISESG